MTDNGNWVISTPHADSPTGYVYVSLIDDNTFICTKNISEATVFASYDQAHHFRDDWNLGGLYTIEAMIPIICKKWDSVKFINDGTRPTAILLESEAKQLIRDTQHSASKKKSLYERVLSFFRNL